MNTPQIDMLSRLAVGAQQFSVEEAKMSWSVSETQGSCQVRVIASANNWIESDAVNQLKKVADWPGMIAAIGMPDLHPGKGAPVGAVFATEGIIYPYLVGNDIGCGMSLWETDLKSAKLKLDKWTNRLLALEDDWDGDLTSWLVERGVQSTAFDSALGTIGGGNHFAELQRVDEVVTDDASMLVNKGNLYLLVHSGSRGLGESVLRKHIDRHADGGLTVESEDFTEYMQAHDHAVSWARANRDLIAHRFLRALGADGTRLLDICHNSVTRGTIGSTSYWFHRKGAAPADRGNVVIPGSRGALSFLVKPTAEQTANLSTLAHGAGRKWGRAECKGRLEKNYSKDSLMRTSLGSRVICEDKNLLYEEAPQAYKNIDVVIKDLIEAGCISTIATFKPVITYKVSKSRSQDGRD